MYYFISTILILLVGNYLCVCDIQILESMIKDHADNGKIIQDELGLFDLKPEINGRLGHGSYSVVWKATLTLRDANAKSREENLTSTSTGRQIAAKFAVSDAILENELDIYTEFGSNGNELVEAYGIPAIYYVGITLEIYATVGVTLCHESLFHRKLRYGFLSELNVLCAFYQALFTIKFIHGRGIIHQDLKSDNFMIRGSRLFLIDFNLSDKMYYPDRSHGGNSWYGSISHMLHLNRYWMDDLKSLFYMMIDLAGRILPWSEYDTHKELTLYKLNGTAVRNLCMEINPAYTILQKVLLSFYDHVMLPTDPNKPELVKEDPRIPPYNEIGEEILKAIEQLTENKSRDVLFKWKKNKNSTDYSMATSKWIIKRFNNLPGGQYSQLGDAEREHLENLGIISTTQH